MHFYEVSVRLLDTSDEEHGFVFIMVGDDVNMVGNNVMKQLHYQFATHPNDRVLLGIGEFPISVITDGYFVMDGAGNEAAGWVNYNYKFKLQDGVPGPITLISKRVIGEVDDKQSKQRRMRVDEESDDDMMKMENDGKRLRQF